MKARTSLISRIDAERLSEPLLSATAIAHTLVGVALYRHALRDIVGNGVVNAVGPHADRQAAFWFLLFSPALLLLRQVVGRAFARGDAGTLRVIGWYLLGTGVAGAVAMPIGGFWFVIAIGGLLLRAARRRTAVSPRTDVGEPASVAR